MLPDTVAELGASCFMGCYDLASAKLSSSLTAIPDDCFSACTVLSDIVIPEQVVSIGSNAFFSCSELSGIFIPASVEEIGENAVGRNYNIRSGGTENIEDFVISGVYFTAAQSYAESAGIAFEGIPPYEYGDVDCNGLVDASDASAVLAEYADLSASGSGSFDELRRLLADIDGNGLIDASDASAILSVYADRSAGM